MPALLYEGACFLQGCDQVISNGLGGQALWVNFSPAKTHFHGENDSEGELDNENHFKRADGCGLVDRYVSHVSVGRLLRRRELRQLRDMSTCQLHQRPTTVLHGNEDLPQSRLGKTAVHLLPKLL